MEIKSWKKTGNKLVREFLFENQTELAECVLKIAKYSDEVNHHADMKITECRKLRVTISTHDVGGLTDRDDSWVRGINELLCPIE